MSQTDSPNAHITPTEPLTPTETTTPTVPTPMEPDHFIYTGILLYFV